MPNIRIKDIPTTASATSSTDFIGIDGSANGTRKLNAYSPTFGGNLTVSGTTGSTFGQIARTNGTNATVLTLSDNLTGVSTTGFGLQIRGVSNNGGVVSAIGFENGGSGTNNESQVSIYTQNTAGSLTRQFQIGSTGNATLTGNLTVSGTGTNSITATKATGGQLPLIYTGDGSYSAWQIQNSNGFVLFGKESTSGGQLFSTATANAGVIAVSGANNFELSTNNTKRLTIDGSTGAVTLSGNLTVSGGTAVLTGGANGGNAPSNDGLTIGAGNKNITFLGNDTGTSYGFLRSWNTIYNHQGARIDFGAPAGNTGDLRLSTNDGTGLTEKARITASGNLLLKSDGTDSSNGKLQLATHTTSAGGIGFGTDTALFRSAAGALQLETSATAVFEIDGGAGNTRGVVIQAAGTEQAAITVAASGTSLLLSTGSPRTLALTLDSSQNATFAGKVRSNGTGFGVGADSDANTPVYALASVNGTFGALIKNSNAGSSAFAAITVEADSGQAGFRQYSTAHSVWGGKTLISAPSGGTGLVLLTNGAGDAIDFWTNATQALSIDASQNIVPGTAALATTATNGFIYLQTCAGAPTGVPTSYTGRVASIYDTTNNKLYIYNGGWKSVTLA